MSTISERAGRGAALLDEKRPGECGAIGWLPVPCGQPAAGFYRHICVHEHVRDGWLCQGHVDSQASGSCRACAGLAGDLAHECPIRLMPIEAVQA
jgi:hypothetical protein